MTSPIAGRLVEPPPAIPLLRAIEGAPRPVLEDPAMRSAFALATRVAPLDIPVLVCGETGTGKELIAHQIHRGGPRGRRELINVNCGALPAHLVEGLLFGHVRGSFTGATEDRVGYFEAADGGTLFLDEVGELDLQAQAALLRALSERRILPVGATREQPVDVRVVAATHRDLEQMSEAGTFRRDLYFRLTGAVLRLPPLRDRSAELRALAERALDEANRKNETRVRGCTDSAWAALESYGWPGNVRELIHVISTAAALADGLEIDTCDLPARISSPKPPPVVRPEGRSLKERVRRFEAEQIIETLDRCDWHQKRAAEMLDLPLRTLVHKIKTLGIKKSGFVE